MKWIKTSVLATCYLIALVLLIELTGHAAFRITQGKWFSSGEFKVKRNKVLEKFELRDQRLAAELDQKPENDGGWRTEIVHPYAGYIVDFHERACGTIGFCDDRIRAYQKQFPQENFVPNTEDNIIVALTGGSFAYGVGNTSSPRKWETALSSIPAFKGKDIYLYTFALGGFKQPQQLNTLSYFLGMGAEFDLIINIDGFNEIALPVAENVGRKLNPYFPRIWHRRVGRSKVDTKLSRLQGEHSFYQGIQAELAKSFQAGWYRNSALANLIWMAKNNNLMDKISAVELETLNYGKEDKVLVSTLEASGPRFKFTDYEDILDQSVTFWSRSSRSLHGVANAHGIPYFHFLQPNQYLKDSKKMTEREKDIAFNDHHPYSRSATTGYPMLVSEGKQLIEDEVNFTDLTQIFANNLEVLYVDACCHLNQAGYDYIVDRIASVIQKYTESTREN